jgi:hypothetical protein
MAGVLSWQIGSLVPYWVFWLPAVALAAFLAFLARPAGPRPLSRSERFLCDTCKYNYGDVCTRPERPNATRCPDYKSSV